MNHTSTLHQTPFGHPEVEIFEQQLVWAPFASAPELLAWYVAAHPPFDETGAVRVDLYALTFPGPAFVTMRPLDSDGTMPRYAVHWNASSRNGLPRLDAMLTVTSARAGQAFWLVLGGTYVPPIGIGGHADPIVGKHVAQMTAHEVLSDAAAVIETRVATA